MGVFLGDQRVQGSGGWYIKATRGNGANGWAEEAAIEIYITGTLIEYIKERQSLIVIS